MRFGTAHAAQAACLSLLAFAASAQEAALTLPQALARAREVNPQLVGLVFELRAQQAQSQLAALRPATQAELLVEDAGGNGARAGLNAAQTTLSLSQVFELGDKRSERAGVADAQVAHLRTAQAARQLDVVADVARRFVRTLALQERVAAEREAVELARRVQAAVEERVRAAASPEAERSRALVATAEAELSLEDAQHSLDTARQELAGAIGDVQPHFTTVAGDLHETPETPPFDDLVKRLEASPDFLLFADEERLRDAELRLAQAQRSVDLRATLGARRHEEAGDTAFVAGVSLPLFPGSRAAPAVAGAKAARERVALARKAAFVKARAQLFAQFQEMQHARHVVATLRDQVLSQLGKALEQTEYAYKRGRYSYLEWSDAQRRLLDARSRYIEAAAEYHIHKIEIERLTGESLSPGDPL
jgi:outer membrane protein, heavy metal efflux system